MKIIVRTVKLPLLFSCVLGLTVLSASAQTPPATPPSPAPAAAPAIDFGDNTSETLTVKAWNALLAKDYPTLFVYTKRCIDTYKTQAVQMQASLKAPAPKDSASTYWALNDVGTCYFIQGQAQDAQGNKKDAAASYKFLVDNLSFAQCWDPKGWFWAPADAARKRLAELQFDAAQ